MFIMENIYENVKFGNDCRNKIIEGVNLCANAVQTTFGPNGRNSVILTLGGVKVTKDGYHTALEVNDSDPYVTMGIRLLQDTSRLTAKSVGDGSSSSAVLTRDLVNAFSSYEHPIKLTRSLKTWSEDVIKQLEAMRMIAASKEDLKKVATISANNDEVIGELVAEAFNHVGKDGVVTLEETEDVKDRVEYSDGFRLDRGYASTYFINNDKGNACELENVYVYISDTKMSEITKVAEIADKALQNKCSLLLIAPGYDSEIFVGLHKNLGILPSCAIISPGHHTSRDMWIKDIKAMLGESMTCQKVIVDRDHTTFIGCKSDQEAIDGRVKEIRARLEGGELGEIDSEVYKKRLANFTSGIATIYVGGYSAIEMKERYDRIEDAVCATQAALTDGILAGGGVTLRTIADTRRTEYADVLCTNNDPEDVFYDLLGNFSEYLETEDKNIEDMINEGVIEPFLVTKTVLENAVATASLILTADVAIVNVKSYLD